MTRNELDRLRNDMLPFLGIYGLMSMLNLHFMYDKFHPNRMTLIDVISEYIYQAKIYQQYE